MENNFNGSRPSRPRVAFDKKNDFNSAREGRSSQDSDFKRTTPSGDSPRRSFNPNFNRENRLRRESDTSFGRGRRTNSDDSDFGRSGTKRYQNTDESETSMKFERRRTSSDMNSERKPFNRDGGNFERKPFNRESDNRGGYERKPFNRDGGNFERKPFNRDIEQNGRPFNRDGADRGGFERKPFNRDGADRGGFERKPFNRDGADRGSFERKPFNRDGADRGGFERKPFNRDGEDRGGFERKPFNRDGADRGGFERKPFNRDGADRGGFERKPFNRDGEDRGGFERKPFNRDGADRGGFERKPFNRDGADRGGFERKPFNRDGADRGGFERKPFNRDGADRGGFERKPFGKTDKNEEAEDQPNFTNVLNELKKGDIRLNRYIAMSGVCSRREADEIITSGKITINGEVVKEMGTKVTINDEIALDGKLLKGERNVYILMNKPKDFVTTLEDPNCKHIVTDLLGDRVKERVYPVGRLDKNSLGVLLLTNDGELTKTLTHPSYQKKKIYHVFLDKDLTDADMQLIATGIELEDGIAFADEISLVEGNRKEIGVEIHSGRNRIVRRMFEHIGYKVRKLDRVYFAGLSKKGLQRGEWRFLTTREAELLKAGKEIHPIG